MKNTLILVFTAIVLSGCTEDFATLNTNGNEPETASGALLLPTVIFDLADLSVNQQFAFGNTIGQYTANYEFNDIDLFRWTSDDRFWGIYSTLQDVADIEQFGTETEDPNYEAVALILRSYGFSILTDTYGDVPYSQATRAQEGVFNPAYDTQEDIYAGLLADLERAASLIDESATITGDILYGGNMNYWKRFANSLRLRLLLRSSNVQDNATAMSTIVSDPDQFPVFENNEQHAVYQYSGSLPDLSPYSVGRGRAYDFYLGIPTTHIIGLLTENNDPRLAVWFDPQIGTTEFVGTAPGQLLGDVGRPDEFASKNAAFFDVANRISSAFLTASEVQFILAEAAEKGLVSGSAGDYYAAAVRLSFAEWDLPVPENYLEITAPYATDTEVLAEQKWLALYRNPLQGWLNWKRTGLPSFIAAGPGTVNNGQVPVRLMYPALEQSVNAVNYTTAAARIGGDNINQRVWWAAP